MGNSDNTVFYRDSNGNLRVFNTNKYMNDKLRSIVGNKISKKSDYENLEELSSSKALNDDYTNSTDSTRDMAKSFYKELGYDKTPVVVSEDEYENLKSQGLREIARGIRGYNDEGKNGKDFLGQYKSGDYYIGNQRVFGSGAYYSYEEDASNTISRYSNQYGVTYTALLDKNAKIIGHNRLQELKNEYTDKVLKKATEISKNDSQKASEYYNKMNNIINRDDGIFASALGYDAIDVEDAKYIVSMNRGKVIIKR